MKIKFNIFLCFVVIASCFVSCKTDEVTPEVTGRGYLEYQYDYVIGGVTKQAYYRVNISDVGFALYDSTAYYMPDTLKAKYPTIYPDSIAKKFRIIELFLYSKECNVDSLLKPLSQPMGASLVQITLVDTLAMDKTPKRLLDFAYKINPITTMNGVTTRKPTALSVMANMGMFLDTVPTPDVMRYKYKFPAQLTKTLNVFSIGNGTFQISTNGLSASVPVSGAGNKIYNLYYTGPVRQLKNISAGSR